MWGVEIIITEEFTMKILKVGHNSVEKQGFSTKKIYNIK